MPSPFDTGSYASGGAAVRRKKKACRRCRHRKQRCDFEQPCHNCEAAGVDCLPVVQEAVQNYPAGYVPALENHAAMLERTLNDRYPGMALDHMDILRTPQINHQSIIDFEPSQGAGYDYLAGTSPDTERILQWQNPQTPNIPGGRMDGGQMMGRTGNQGSPEFVTHSFPAAASRVSIVPPSQVVGTRSETMEEIPTATAASFFRTYFQAIHPQYPFLNMKDCGDWYTEWKIAPAHTPIVGWPAFFVKMIFAIGSLIQSKSDAAPRYQHQDLKSQAQSEDSIIRSTKSSPLVRLQAMLLSAMHALHSESTARISHISGAIIRFASLHGFHRLRDTGDEESGMKIKAWSCAYILDRAVSVALDVPASLADAYISTPLYVVRPESISPMPWLDDLPPSTPQITPSLKTFAHTCKIRLIQSYINHTMQAVPIEGGPSATPEWQESMRLQIDNWADEIYSHSLTDEDGYQSPLWLSLIGQLSRITLYRPSRFTIHTPIAEVSFLASCETCTTFRSLQKKRQVAQPWLVVITQFQAGVTILYTIWARAIPIPTSADLAIRDCTSVLAILADRWQNAEFYRDCFEVLARAIGTGKKRGVLGREARSELGVLIEGVVEVGLHGHVRLMLQEMAEWDEDEGGSLDREMGMGV